MLNRKKINRMTPFIIGDNILVCVSGYSPALTRPHMCASARPCVRPAPLYGWWLGFRIVSGLSVINMPGRVGPKKYITNRRGGRVHMEGRGWRGGGSKWEKK